ncbi:DUF4410 domain-containing protein [Novispirillum itersonii]|uniref:DUF4410 domain-containing protein n=1 Tax=Novispirillum itersonii TaxID=189 RepID=UPI0003A42380|nr:DUF4410 domain-containing protein [Novispirillum itersonii]
MNRLILSFLALLALSACSTAVVPQQAIPSDVQSKLRVSEVKATVSAGVQAPADLDRKLEKAVQAALAAKKPQGVQPARLVIRITKYEIVDGAARVFVGVFAGSNKLYASVDVVDVQSGAVIGRFDVQRNSNPGGYGAFYDQSQATIDEAAEGIANGIFPTGNTQ